MNENNNKNSCPVAQCNKVFNLGDQQASRDILSSSISAEKSCSSNSKTKFTDSLRDKQTSVESGEKAIATFT